MGPRSQDSYSIFILLGSDLYIHEDFQERRIPSTSKNHLLIGKDCHHIWVSLFEKSIYAYNGRLIQQSDQGLFTYLKALIGVFTNQQYISYDLESSQEAKSKQQACELLTTTKKIVYTPPPPFPRG